jgi:predicted nucleotidyltransferase
VVRAHLFGSVARGEERAESDLDQLGRFGADGDSFAEHLRLSEELERLCGRRVDVLTNIHPAFAPYTEPTLIPLPL